VLMVLDPGEVFEHSHSDVSITVLVRGTVELAMEDTRTLLRRGEVVTVGAATPHTLTNVGPAKALVECVH
jgi:quercetin dioxygenase-like cupin family protein